MKKQSKRYLFFFIEGGWNQSFGIDEQDAYQNAVKEYDYTDTLNPDPKSFKLASEHQELEQSLLRSFW